MEKLMIEAAQKAKEVILFAYKKKIPKFEKEDGSPLTIADELAHFTIMNTLAQSGYPVVSEEGDSLHLDEKDYWLVDPLDGTKDFLAQNGQFTINIAFMKNNHPILGVIYAPALDEWYTSFDSVIATASDSAVGSNRVSFAKVDRHSSSSFAMTKELSMAISNFHDCEKTGKFADLNKISQKVPMGSALKFGRMAKGLVDVYPRFVGTSEWDTAAGHAILEAIGGKIIDLETKETLKYGKGPKRQNGSFIALAPGLTLDQFLIP